MKDTKIDGFPDPHNYQKWWDFTDQPPVHSFPLETVTAGANAGDDTAATLVGVIPSASVLLGGYAVVSANSTNVAAAPDASAWSVTIAGTEALTLTRVADFVADTPVAMTVAVPNVAVGSAVKLAITNGTNADLNSAVCHVGLQLADVNNFPAPGLTAVISNLGTATVADGVKGILAITPGAADNDEIYVAAATETQKFASGAVFMGEAYVQWTEANTDDANVIFGYKNAVAANALIDDGGGPAASGDYVCLWKVDGGTKWYCGVQSNGTQTPTTDTLGDPSTTAGGSSYQKLKIKVTCTSSTAGFAEFWVDEQNIGTVHFTYASATEMQLFVGVKNGSANRETLNIDYLGFADNRVA